MVALPTLLKILGGIVSIIILFNIYSMSKNNIGFLVVLLLAVVISGILYFKNRK